MKVWNLFYGALAACLLALPTTASAIILPDLNSTGTNGTLEMKIINAENLKNQGGNANFLEVGDRLRGIIKVTSISQNGTPIWVDFSGNLLTNDPLTPDQTEITGIFDVKVLSRTFLNAGLTAAAGDDVYSFVFGATGNLGSFLTGTGADPAKTAMVLFAEELESGAADSDRLLVMPPLSATTTETQAEFLATGGQVYTALGGTFGPPGPASDVYWVGVGTQNPNSIGSGIGTTNFGLNMLFNGTGFNFAKVDDPNDSTFNDLVDLYGKSSLKRIVGSPYAVQSDDPVVAKILPEPMSLSIWGGIMVLGMAGTALRRKLARKA